MSEWGLSDTPEVRWHLAMAWDEWAPQVRNDYVGGSPHFRGSLISDPCVAGQCKHYPGYLHGYWVDHGGDRGAHSKLTYEHKYDHEDQPYLAIHMLKTDDNHRKDGVAEAMIRRLTEDHPGVRIDPGFMTVQGKGFSNRMFEKEPAARDLVTASADYDDTPYWAAAWDDEDDEDEDEPHHKHAMAWQDWEHRIQDLSSGNDGWYEVDHGQDHENNEDDESNLVFSVRPEDNMIDIDGIGVHGDYQGQGIAEALMRRLHQDYPNYRINPGGMTPDGQGFHDRMLEKEPDAKNLVAQARRLLVAMAWEDWKDKITGGCEGCEKGDEGRYIIPQAGAFLDYSHGSYMGHPEISIGGIYTHPSNRGDGVAEALMRRLVEDHPGIRINPGFMTNDGKKFHDRMLDKEPEAKSLVETDFSHLMNASHHTAMAWQDYVDKIQYDPEWREYKDSQPLQRYFIDHGPSGNDSFYDPPRISELNFEEVPNGVLGEKELSIDYLRTDPDFRGDGVAEALFRRMHKDYPDHMIYPGGMTPNGKGFHDRMLEKEPAAKDLIVARFWQV